MSLGVGAMKMHNRLINMDLPPRQSAFLWGARKTGKSTYLKLAFPDSLYFDLLKNETLVSFSRAPELFREVILGREAYWPYPIIVDEVQKVPPLLNEIHWLIENTSCQFILCGSSARKLKRGAGNLLGGRAWSYHFYPFFYRELPEFNLLHALNYGLIPGHYLFKQPRRSLKAYVTNYLREEIQEEGLSRDLPAFSRFLDVAAFSCGELVNYTSIARESHIDSRTVKNYFQILQDTLVGYLIYPYSHRKKRELVTATPKFYFFDVGVSQYLRKIEIQALKGPEAGRAFEQFILMEIMGYRGIHDYDFDIHFWRSKDKYEVDFILGDGQIAIEVKINAEPHKNDLKGLITFQKEHHPQRCYVVCQASHPRKIQLESGYILLLPWQDFLNQLWQGDIISG